MTGAMSISPTPVPYHTPMLPKDTWGSVNNPATYKHYQRNFLHHVECYLRLLCKRGLTHPLTLYGPSILGVSRNSMSGMTSVQRILGGKRISIPAEASRELNLDEGDFVIVKVEDGSMRITPAKVIPRK